MKIEKGFKGQWLGIDKRHLLMPKTKKRAVKFWKLVIILQPSFSCYLIMYLWFCIYFVCIFYLNYAKQSWNKSVEDAGSAESSHLLVVIVLAFSPLDNSSLGKTRTMFLVFESTSVSFIKKSTTPRFRTTTLQLQLIIIPKYAVHVKIRTW